MSEMLSWLTFVGIAFLGAIPGIWCMPGAWYAGLKKPFFNPPNWIFGPVWSLLYVLIGTSAWLVYSRNSLEKSRVALACWGVQLLLNMAWTPLFFGMHRMDLAFIEIIIMAIAIAVTIVQFFYLNQIAGWMLVPYLFWVMFASVLNFSLWQLNR